MRYIVIPIGFPENRLFSRYVGRICIEFLTFQLEEYRTGGDPDSVAGDFGVRPLYKMLGYFSLIGLLRLHSLLGDYSMALKVLGNIELNRKVCICYAFKYFALSYLAFRYCLFFFSINSVCKINLSSLFCWTRDLSNTSADPS